MFREINIGFQQFRCISDFGQNGKFLCTLLFFHPFWIYCENAHFYVFSPFKQGKVAFEMVPQLGPRSHTTYVKPSVYISIRRGLHFMISFRCISQPKFYLLFYLSVCSPLQLIPIIYCFCGFDFEKLKI